MPKGTNLLTRKRATQRKRARRQLALFDLKTPLVSFPEGEVLVGRGRPLTAPGGKLFVDLTHFHL